MVQAGPGYVVVMMVAILYQKKKNVIHQKKPNRLNNQNTVYFINLNLKR